MTPTDYSPPPRVAPAADTGAVRPANAKAGKEPDAASDSEFPHLLNKVAQDKDQPTKAQDAAKGPAAERPKESAIDRWRRLEAQKAGHASGRAGAATRGQDGADGESDVPGDAQGDVVQPDATAQGLRGDATTLLGGLQGSVATAPDAAQGALAALLAQGRNGAQGLKSQGDTAADAALAVTGEAAGRQVPGRVRDVKIGVVQVETHFAAAGTDPATASFAQKLSAASALSGQGLQKSGDTAAAAGSSRASNGDMVSGIDAAQEIKGARGRLAAGHGADRGDADASGAGAGKSDGEAKVAAAAERGRAAAGAVDLDAPSAQTAAPMQQLGSRIIAAAAELGTQAAAAASGAAPDPGATNVSPVRVLSINLHPEELGSVTVRMSLVRDRLEVQIEAEHSSTARMLQTDRDALSDMLRSAGIQVDGVTVRAASPDSVSTSAGAGQGFLDQQTQSQSGSGQSNGRADARTAGGNGRNSQGNDYAERATGRGGNEDTGSQRSIGGGLYV